MQEHNEALALKYRPLDFDELVGQESVSKTLSLALNTKRLSHAYLFSGLRGSGKTSSARIFARSLQCENGPKAKPCGVCANCIAANPHKMRHIDIIELDGASNRKIDDIRDLIEQTKYHPNMGRFKIFIIDEAHMLTKEAFNALLKTLEEPPPYVKFILATTDPLKLPATILSRTQHFRFKRISDKSILEHLKNILQKENIPYEEEALKMLIRSGSGSLRDTLTLLDQVIIYSNYNITTNACANMLGLINPQSLQSLFECILENNREKLLKDIEGFLEYESEMLLEEMSIFLKDKLLKGDNTYNIILIDRLFRIIAQAKELLFLGSDDSFVLTLSLLKMLEAMQIQEIDVAIENLKNQIPQIPTSPNPSPTLSPTLAQTPTLTKQNPSLFQLLLQKIYERNYDLGECFEKNITFISFDENLLVWESKA
ncbi:MAG: DNA polymerase III subunit gamma/tau, partial [Helicobacter sp.]|nr:DNA polymerase III subunit gamma/tau [Helicobacter sp.]